MNLDEFVSEVLSKIISGIREAQQHEGGAFIVASGTGGQAYAKHARVSSSSDGRLKFSIVDFDIALTVETSGHKEGSAGVRVAGIGAGIGGESSSRDARTSRIQFGVPILLPASTKDWSEELQESAITAD